MIPDDGFVVSICGIALTLVNFFTFAYFISHLLKDRNESRFPALKYFVVMVIVYLLCRTDDFMYTNRLDIIFVFIFLSTLIFSSDRWYKKILLILFLYVMMVFANASANIWILPKYSITLAGLDAMTWDEAYVVMNGDKYAFFLTTAFGYSVMAFIQMCILIIVNRKTVRTFEVFLINLFTIIMVALATIPLYFSGDEPYMMIIGVVVYAISIFSMIYSYSRLRFYQEYSKTEAENKFLKEKEVMQLEYYNEMRVKEEQIRKINHDIKNNMSVIYGLKNDKDRDKFIKKIDEDLKRYELVKYSSNDILNIVLNTKISKAKALGIKVDVDIKNNVNFMEDIDMSNLFTNILDNAIENSSLVDEKFIKFSIRKKLGNIIIECMNSYDGKVDYKNKRFKSRKNEEHGYGLKIIGDIVKKYDGEKNIEYNEDTFTISLMIREADK